MSDTFSQFEKRLDSLERKHRELSNGYVAKINPDGLITVEPKQSNRAGLLLRLCVMVVFGFLAFKVVTLMVVGVPVYETRLDTLMQGSAIEKAIAWMMQIDPISEKIAAYLITIF